LHRINNYNQPMTQLKTRGRKNGVNKLPWWRKISLKMQKVRPLKCQC
jgi:hypothetical protein